jgi:hypothetical protein
MAMFLEKIKSMWKQLSVPESEQAAFLATLSRAPKDYETVREFACYFLILISYIS